MSQIFKPPRASKIIYPLLKPIEASGNLTGIHVVFAPIFKTLGNSFLLFSLALWVFAPILGLPFLLIYSQSLLSEKISANKKAKINLWVVVVVIFTTTIYSASIYPYSDTANYINYFSDLQSFSSLTDFSEFYGIEPGSFFLPSLLSFGEMKDGLWFLLIQSFTLNLVFTLYAVFFLPEIYPLAILLNVTGFNYFHQLFLMRQIYALIFIIPAIHTSKLWLKVALLWIAFNTHSSSIIFLPALFIPYLIKWKGLNFVLKHRIYLRVFALLVLVSIIASLIFIPSLVSILSNYTNENFRDRAFNTEYNSSTLTYTFSITSFTKFLYFIAFLFSIFGLDQTKLKSIRYSSWLLYSLILSVCLFVSDIFSMLNIYTGPAIFYTRPSYYLLALPYFFIYFSLLLWRNRDYHMKWSMRVLVGIISSQVLLFIYDLIRMQQGGSELLGVRDAVFWNGYPISASILDYFELLQRALS